MKRLKLLAVFVVYVLTSLFYVHGIYAYLTSITEPSINTLTIKNTTSYTVIHEFMKIDGTTYKEENRFHFDDVPLGTEVSPPVLTVDGFTSPEVQTVVLDSFEDTVITYQYTRHQHTLTITDSQYVTTDTPSGTYYYGQEIHLVADPTNNLGAPFVQWTNDVTNPDYTFVMTEDVTIGPIYSNSYLITYVPNNVPDNPSYSFTERVMEDEPISEFPSVTYNDCSGSTGSYQDRGCTYFYQLIGWYKEPNFVTKVDETFVPTEDTTLYAKWNKVYFSQLGQTEFDGNTIINTGVQLFSELNAKRDFIATFTVDEYTGYNPTNNTDKRATIFTCMKEGVEPYYGVHFFRDNTNYAVNANSSKQNRLKDYTTGYETGQKVIMKRENGIIWYSYDDGETFTSTGIDFTNFTQYFDNPAVFGGGLDQNLNPYRFLIGKLSDLTVELLDVKSYTIHYDANGGTGVMADQIVELGDTPALSPNGFIYDDSSFAGWNTEPDGSGTSYPYDYVITSDLGGDGDVITLYAQWDTSLHFYVHFNANGGTGSMDDQRFTISAPAEPLSANEFIREGYVFRGWNTAADGSGTHYDDQQAVRDLSGVDEDVVTLYAEWWKVYYNVPGDVVFDGTIATFRDTGVNIFSTTNLNKDFEIRFTFKSVDSDQLTYTSKQPTIFNARDESHPKGPGFMLRFQNSKITDMSIMAKWSNNNGNSSNITTIQTNKAPIELVFKREGGIITAQYFYGNNQSSTVYTVLNQNSWTLTGEVTTNVAFGGYFDAENGNAPGRFFKGTLADISIIMQE